MEPEMKEVTYRHAVLEGTSYECGRQLGEQIREGAPWEHAMYAELRDGQKDIPDEKLAALLSDNDRYCPGINDELRGLADGMGIPLKRLASTILWKHETGGCSHIVALPAATIDGHVLAARSYEWSLDDALRLVTTRVTGHYAHIGFSIMGAGRFDGLNEKGLCVTMSAGAPGLQPDASGFMFWVGMRAALDRCATVEEALPVLTAPPSCTCDIIIVSDRGGNAALIENDCGHRAVKRVGPGSSERWLYATNHYTLPGMAGHGNKPMWMSTARSLKISEVLATTPAISIDTLRGLLSAPVPEGLCCHYYNEWFGTLWSMLFDVTEGAVEVCFGSPAANAWHKFGLDDPQGLREYTVSLPIEKCTDPKFFAREA